MTTVIRNGGRIKFGADDLRFVSYPDGTWRAFHKPSGQWVVARRLRNRHWRGWREYAVLNDNGTGTTHKGDTADFRSLEFLIMNWPTIVPAKGNGKR